MTSGTITVIVVVLALAAVAVFVMMSGPPGAIAPRVAGAVGLSTSTQSGFVASPESFHQGEVIS